MEEAAVRSEAVPGRVRALEPRNVVELYLFAFAPQAEVLHHLRTIAVPEEHGRLPDILEQWRQLRGRIRELEEREAGLPDKIRSVEIPLEYHAPLQAVEASPFFQKTFQDFPHTFEVVEIDKMIAPQRSVNGTYAEQLRASFPAPPTFDDLLEICLAPERPVEPIRHVQAGPNTHVFSSPVADMRFLDSAVRDVTAEDLQIAESGGIPTTAVLSFVGYGCSSINVFRVGSRIILNNGFHRVYALRSLGVTDIPVVVQHLQHVPLELPSSFSGLPVQYVLHAPRPVLMKDFLEPGFTVSLGVRERLRVVKVTVNHSKYDVLV